MLTPQLVETHDKKKIEGNRKIINDVGTIRIDIHRTTTLGTRCDAKGNNLPKSCQTDLAEKALKGQALSHSTSGLVLTGL